MKGHWVTRVTAVVVMALAVSAMTVLAGDDKKEVFTAFAVNMGATGPAGATTFEITITRWSTEDERAQLLQTLQEKGHKDFMKALRKLKETGFVEGSGVAARLNPFPSTRLHYAYQVVENGVRHILLVTDRPIGMREAASGNRSLDYDATAIQFEFPAEETQGKKTKGKGLMYMALKIGVDKDTKKMKVEEWGNEPIRLTDIQRRK